MPEDTGTQRHQGSREQPASSQERAGRGAGGNRAAVTNGFNSSADTDRRGVINGRSTSAWPRERGELLRQRMEQQGATLAGGRLGTTLEISLGMKTTQRPAPLLPRHPPDHLPRGSPAGLRPFSHSPCPPSCPVSHTHAGTAGACACSLRDPIALRRCQDGAEPPSVTRKTSSCGSLQVAAACPQG